MNLFNVNMNSTGLFTWAPFYDPAMVISMMDRDEHGGKFLVSVKGQRKSRVYFVKKCMLLRNS